MFFIIEEFQNLDLTENGEKLFKAMEAVMDEMKEQGVRNFSYLFSGSQVNAMESIFVKRHFFYRKDCRDNTFVTVASRELVSNRNITNLCNFNMDTLDDTAFKLITALT